MRTAIHDFEAGVASYTEKEGHRFLINGDFEAVDPRCEFVFVFSVCIATLSLALLSAFHALFLPGGRAPEYLRLNARVLAIVRHFAENNKPIATVCHGAQLLAAARVLEGKRVAAYPACQFDVETVGGEYAPCANDSAVVCGNMVSTPLWSGQARLMAEFIKLIGTRVTNSA